MACATAPNVIYNPAYPESFNFKSSKVALTDYSDLLVITSLTRLRYDLGVSDPEVPQLIKSLSQESLNGDSSPFKKSGIPIISAIDSTTPVETIKLREKTFIKVKLPAQGTSLISNNIKPEIIFIVHEASIGINLNATRLYVHSEGSNKNINEASATNLQSSLNIVLTYTIWDNLKQQFLQHGIIQTETPFQETVTPNTIKGAFNSANFKISQLVSDGNKRVK
jgi:hypothetical protein